MTVFESLNNICCISFFDNQMYFRIFFDECIEKHREQSRHHSGNDTEFKITSDKTFLNVDNILNTFRLIHNSSSLFYYLLTYRSQLNRFFGTVKNDYIEFFLQLLNLHTQSGLRNKTFFGC